jgi:hypothetical protein
MSSFLSDGFEESLAERRESRRLLARYIVLTAAIFLPLLAAFVLVKNVYPVTSWTVMTSGGTLGQEVVYFRLRGETLAGETVEIPAIELTDALSAARNWGMVNATASNASFRLRSPHPDNLKMLLSAGSVDKLPRATRLPELLRAWGTIYNARQSGDSSHRLRAIRLDAYLWDGQRYGDYDKFIESWRAEL